MIHTLTISVGYKPKNSTLHYSEQRVYLCDIVHKDGQSDDNLWDVAYDILDIILDEIPSTKDFIDPSSNKPTAGHFAGADIRCLTPSEFPPLSEAMVSKPLLLTSYDIAFNNEKDFERFSKALQSSEDPTRSFKAQFLSV